MHPSPHRPDRRFVAVAVAALALAGACVKQDDPGMDVVALDASIVFGFDAPKPAEPLAFVPPPVEYTPEEFEDLPEAPVVPLPAVPRPTPPSHLCPTAGLAEFPEAAPVDVSVQPKEGAYLWRLGPPTVLGTDHFAITNEQIFERVIFNVSPVTESVNPTTVADESPVITRTFTYQMATLTRDGAVLDTFKVVSGGITEDVAAVNFGPTFYTGQPDRGVSLVSREVIVNNRVVASFTPSTPILLLPLPAIGGATFQSVSVDPVSGTTYMLYGEVKERARVDACGKEVDGWRVVAQAALRDPTSAGAAPRTATLTYFVATGAGGVLTHEARSPLELPRFPINGTPLDGAIPPNPELPDAGANASAYEISLASRDPRPASRPVPTPQAGGLGGD